MTTAVSDKRIDARLTKVFPVIVASELFGDSYAVARNISPGGLLVEMADALPLGSVVTVHFRMPDCPGDIVARAEVKHHYCLNYTHAEEWAATRGIGLRFIQFEEGKATALQTSFSRSRVLH